MRAQVLSEPRRLRQEDAMAAVNVGVVKEAGADEHRVAVVPEVVPRVRELGTELLVESDAGAGAWFADSAYTEAGASVVAAAAVDAAPVLVCVAPPPLDRI